MERLRNPGSAAQGFSRHFYVIGPRPRGLPDVMMRRGQEETPPGETPMQQNVVNCAAYEAGRRVADIDLEQASHIETGDKRFVWIGLHEPDEDLLKKVQARFGLHDLAIEDAHMAHQRPKLEFYDNSLFIALRTARLEGGKTQCG